MFMNRKGFTLIELIMVIVLLGLLAIVAIPKYYDLQQDAKLASDKGVVGAVRSGLYTYFAKNKTALATIGGTAATTCSSVAPCFAPILDQGGIQESWSCVTAGLTYTGPSGTVANGGIGTCTYIPPSPLTAGAGTFSCA